MTHQHTVIAQMQTRGDIRDIAVRLRMVAQELAGRKPAEHTMNRQAGV